MSEDLSKIEIRSEEVQEIIGNPPRWIIRWGVSIMFILVVVLIIGSCFYKYPEIIQSTVIVNTENMPAVIAANIPGNYTYYWLTTPPQQGITASGLPSGVYLAVVTDSTCYDTLAVAISNIEGPTALFETTPPSASSTNPVIRFINQTEGMHSSYWTFGDGATSHMESPIHEYLLSDSFVVVLEVTDTYGCIDTVSKTVLIYDDINVFIPNAFSPNEDGLNEVFKPVGRGVNPASPYEMIIYDRWGKMVFSTNKFEEGWNGYVRGSKIKVTGTFIYRITLYDFANKKHVYKGNFSFLGSKSDGDF